MSKHWKVFNWKCK